VAIPRTAQDQLAVRAAESACLEIAWNAPRTFRNQRGGIGGKGKAGPNRVGRNPSRELAHHSNARVPSCRHGQGASISGPSEPRGRRWLALADRIGGCGRGTRRHGFPPCAIAPGNYCHVAGRWPHGESAAGPPSAVAPDVIGRAPTPNEGLDALLGIGFAERHGYACITEQGLRTVTCTSCV
jgi:hypothetical protein